MVYEEIIIVFLGALVALMVFLLYRFSRVGPGAEAARLIEMEKTLAVLNQQVVGLEGKVTDLRPTVDEIQRKAFTLDERTSILPKTHQLAVQTEDRTRALPGATKQLSAIEAKVNRVDTLDAKLDELRGVFLSDRKRGRVGEEAVAKYLGDLPDDLWRAQVGIGEGRADFVAVMPNGLCLPIDSKTGGSDVTRDLYGIMDRMDEHPGEEDSAALQNSLDSKTTALAKKIRDQAHKVSEYMKQDARCLPFAVEAVPDPVFDILPGEVRRECSEHNVEVVPYSLLLPFIGSMRRLNTYGKSDVERIVDSLVKVRSHLTDLEDVVANRIDKPQKMLAGAVSDIRGILAGIQKELAVTQDRPGAPDETPTEEA